MAARLTDEELEAMLERVRGDKGEIYHNYFLGLKEAKDSRRKIKRLENLLGESYKEGFLTGAKGNPDCADAIIQVLWEESKTRAKLKWTKN